MAKQKIPSQSEIQSKIDNLKQATELSIEKAKQGKSSPQREFLKEIQDVVKYSLDNGVSYKEIKTNIYNVYSFKVSEATIKAFAQSVGIAKPKKRGPATAGSPNKVFSDSSKIKEDMGSGNGDSIGEPTL